MEQVETVIDTTQQTAQQTAEEVNSFIQYVQNNIPNIIGFGIKVIMAIIFFILGRMLIKFFRKIVRKALEKSGVDKGVEQFVDSLLRFGLYALLIATLATKLGVDTTSVAAIIASAGVAVGLALQGSLSNFAGGVLILVLKPFKVGDYIIENNHGNEGTVHEIQMFYTKLATIDNRIVILPNSLLTNGSLVNVTGMDKRNLILTVSISYDTDIKHAKDVLWDVMLAENMIDQSMEKKVYVNELGDDGVELGLRAWVAVDDYWDARWKVLEDIKYAFDAADIEIPYHKLDVQMKKES